MAPTLGYWNTRGLGEPIRYILAYTGTDYEDKRYPIGPAPLFDKSQYLSVKQNLGLDFPNLPYWIDGNVKLTQSNAILRHIARNNKLDGKNEEQKIRIDLAEQQFADYNQAFFQVTYDPKYQTLKADYIKSLQQNLQQFSQFLGNRPFIAGDHLTYVDFIAYEFLTKNDSLTSGGVKKIENLKNFLLRIETLPQIAKYLKSTPKTPFNAPMAGWGID